MKTRGTVFVTGVSGETGQGIMAGLRKLDPSPWIVGLDYTADNAGFQLADKGVQVPGIHQPNYIDSLKSQIEEHAADALFLGIDGEIEIVAPHRDAFASLGCHVGVSAPALVSVFADKLSTAEFLNAQGLPSPHTVCAKGTVDEILSSFSFPLVVKLRRGHGSRDVEVVRDEARLRHIWPSLDEAYCVQEFIDGPEFTVSLLFDRQSNLCDSLTMRRELVDGRTMQSHVESHPSIEAFVTEFGQISDALGSINLQLRLDAEDRALVFEINPRFSGSTSMRVAAGYNEPARLFQHLVEGQAISASRVEACSIYRHWTELVVRPT